ncbi:MAG: DUF58 domain-containing protein [Fuerstiella sp.]
MKLTLSAAALTQLLSAMACFLGAFVLPNTFQEFRGISEYVLIGLGIIMLILGLTNLFFGSQISRLMQRIGRRSRVVVPREGVGYLAIMLVLAVGALLGHRNMPLLVFGMMAGPFVFNGWVVHAMLRGVQVKRIAPDRAIAGQFTTVQLEVTNTKRWLASQLIEVSDRIVPLNQKGFKTEQEVGVSFVRVPGQSVRTGRYRLQFPRRGKYRLGSIRLSSRFPMGIGERGQVLSDEVEIIVHPAIGRLLPEWARQQKEFAEANQRVKSGMGLFDDEFHRVREYRSDDNPRAIHWRSTAKQGQLMVREFHQTRQADSVVVLDLPDSKDWTQEDRELAISFAATVCLQQANSASGSTMLLGVSGKTNQWIASRNPAAFREEALDALALCGRSADPNLTGLFRQVIEEHPTQDDRLIIITPRPNDVIQTIADVTKQHDQEGMFAAKRMTVVEARKSRLDEVFRLDESSSVAASSSEGKRPALQQPDKSAAVVQNEVSV